MKLRQLQNTAFFYLHSCERTLYFTPTNKANMNLILTTNLSAVKALPKNEVAKLIDQCETALSDMIRAEGSDGCTTDNLIIKKADIFIGKLIDIFNSK